MALTFLGALITTASISNGHRETPPVRSQVIDGQQRLTTLMLIICALHERLTVADSAVRASGDLDAQPEEVAEWLVDQIEQAQSELLGCLYWERAAGDEGYRRLPKVVRELVDTWGKRAAEASYRSPVAHLVHLYVRSCVLDDAPFQLSIPQLLEVPESFGASLEDHELIQRRFRQIRRMIRDVERGTEAELDYAIELEQLLDTHSRMYQAMWPESSDPAREGLLALALEEDGANALRLVLFARFLLDHVAMTQIRAEDEGYAFDLFDALNTTGEPLTAFETFVRLVVEAEGQAGHYADSPSRTHIAITGKLLREREGSAQNDTLSLITSFLLADHGAKVPTNHNDQRKVLQRRYEFDGITLEDKRKFTRQLADSGLGQFGLWRDQRLRTDTLDEGIPVGNAAAFALSFARSLNHSILIAPLARFTAQYRDDPSPANQAEVERAVLAMVAFSALWRAAHGGTDGIDNVYRRLMRDGLEVAGPLARCADENPQTEYPLPTSAEVATALRHAAEAHPTRGFGDVDGWRVQAASQPLYEQGELTRFLLLIGDHHAAPSGTSGLTEDGPDRPDTDFINPVRWHADDLATIEHVAPQTPTDGGWPADVYQNPTVIHQLGNLSLIPLSDNSRLSNRPWAEKRSIYRALTAESDAHARTALQPLIGQNDFTQDLADRVVEGRRYLPILRAVASYEGEWNRAFVEDRTNHLLGRAWNVLWEWLNPPAQ